MHHLLAYSAAMAAAATDNKIAAVVDGQITISSNGAPIFDEEIKIRAAYGQGATMSNLRINTPPLRTIALPRLSPFKVGALPGNLPPLVDMRLNPLTVPPTNEIAIEASNTGAGEQQWAGLWVTKGSFVVPQGDIITIDGTSVTAAVANTWTNVVTIWETPLPGGTFEVVGMRALSATGVFARLVFPGGGWRPGCLMSAGENENDFGYFRWGRFGSYGTFKSYVMPTVQVLCTGATAAHEFYLDLIQRGPA